MAWRRHWHYHNSYHSHRVARWHEKIKLLMTMCWLFNLAFYAIIKDEFYIGIFSVSVQGKLAQWWKLLHLFWPLTKELTVLTQQSHFADTKPSFVSKSLLLTIELTHHAQKLSWYFCFGNADKRWLLEHLMLRIVICINDKKLKTAKNPVVL